jgi:hypothetical protein
MASGGRVGSKVQNGSEFSQMNRPELTHWHASEAKNTSHMFAMSRFLDERSGMGGGVPQNQTTENLRDLILCCLDADNVFEEAFTRDAMKTLHEARTQAYRFRYARHIFEKGQRTPLPDSSKPRQLSFTEHQSRNSTIQRY